MLRLWYFWIGTNSSCNLYYLRSICLSWPICNQVSPICNQVYPVCTKPVSTAVEFCASDYGTRVCTLWFGLLILIFLLVIKDNPCTPDEFSCRDLHCIPLLQVCDGILHCRDGSDESSCMNRPGRGWGWFYFI